MASAHRGTNGGERDRAFDLPAAFEDVLAQHLRELGQRLEFAACAVSRITGDEWILLHAEGRAGALRSGMCMRRSDSLCFRMLRGQGPAVARAVTAVPAYADARMVQIAGIRAYAAAPLIWRKGTVFGTVWAMDSVPKSGVDPAWQGALTEAAGQLSAVIGEEDQIMEHARAAESELYRDSLDADGLLPAGYWRQMLESEEQFRTTLASPTGLIAVLPDDSGSAAITVAGVQQLAVTELPLVRGPGQSFCLLLPDCDAEHLSAVSKRITHRLRALGIAARCVSESVSIARSLPFAGEEFSARLRG